MPTLNKLIDQAAKESLRRAEAALNAVGLQFLWCNDDSYAVGIADREKAVAWFEGALADDAVMQKAAKRYWDEVERRLTHGAKVLPFVKR